MVKFISSRNHIWNLVQHLIKILLFIRSIVNLPNEPLQKILMGWDGPLLILVIGYQGTFQLDINIFFQNGTNLRATLFFIDNSFGPIWFGKMKQ